MPERLSTPGPILKKEALILLVLLVLGLVALPAAIFVVGGAVFGAYADGGFGSFYGALLARMAAAETVAWFLVLSPYLAVQTLRATFALWRRAGRRDVAG